MHSTCLKLALFSSQFSASSLYKVVLSNCRFIGIMLSAGRSVTRLHAPGACGDSHQFVPKIITSNQKPISRLHQCTKSFRPTISWKELRLQLVCHAVASTSCLYSSNSLKHDRIKPDLNSSYSILCLYTYYIGLSQYTFKGHVIIFPFSLIKYYNFIQN